MFLKASFGQCLGVAILHIHTITDIHMPANCRTCRVPRATQRDPAFTFFVTFRHRSGSRHDTRLVI